MLFNLKKTIQKKKNKVHPGIISPIFPAFDATLAPNNVAIWDGDQNLVLNNSWEDFLNAELIDFTGSGTLPLTGGTLNGHNTVIFNGTDQYGNTPTPVLNAPFTFYVVFRLITHTVNDYIIADGDSNVFLKLYTVNPSPNIRLEDASNTIAQTNTVILNTWVVLTIIMNGVSSGLRVNLNNIISGIGDNFNQPGIGIGSAPTGTNFSNSEFAYIIMRDVADPTWLQNNFINWLKTRFAI